MSFDNFQIMNVRIERHECLTIDGEEEGRCGVDIVHGGIPHGRAYPPARGAHGGGQYPWSEAGGGVLKLWSEWPARGGGGQYPAGGGDGQYAAGGGGGSHVKVCPAVGDPPHGITGVGPI
jgi:hypothetical protein